MNNFANDVGNIKTNRNAIKENWSIDSEQAGMIANTLRADSFGGLNSKIDELERAIVNVRSKLSTVLVSEKDEPEQECCNPELNPSNEYRNMLLNASARIANMTKIIEDLAERIDID